MHVLFPKKIDTLSPISANEIEYLVIQLDIMHQVFNYFRFETASIEAIDKYLTEQAMTRKTVNTFIFLHSDLIIV